MPGSLRSSRITSGASSAASASAGGPVAGLAGHLDPVLHLEQGPQPLPDDRMVVHDQHPDGRRHWLPPAGTVIRTLGPGRARRP